MAQNGHDFPMERKAALEIIHTDETMRQHGG
jgi:hypothetical protein